VKDEKELRKEIRKAFTELQAWYIKSDLYHCKSKILDYIKLYQRLGGQ
jgi:hypothetical protein